MVQTNEDLFDYHELLSILLSKPFDFISIDSTYHGIPEKTWALTKGNKEVLYLSFLRDQENLSVIYAIEDVVHKKYFTVPNKSTLIVSKEIKQFIDETILRVMF